MRFELFERVFNNYFSNALSHIDGGKMLKIGCEVVEDFYQTSFSQDLLYKLLQSKSCMITTQSDYFHKILILPIILLPVYIHSDL